MVGCEVVENGGAMTGIHSSWQTSPIVVMVVFLTNEKVGFSLDFVIEWGEGSNLLLVLVLQDCCNLPHIVVFVAWLDAKLLSDVNSGHDQSGTVSKTHTGIVFSLQTSC